MHPLIPSLRLTSIAAMSLAAAQAIAQSPDLSISNAEFVGGARIGFCNTLRVTVRNTSMTPVTTDFQVAYVVVLEGPTAFPATMHGGIGGNTTKTMSFSNVTYWGAGLPTGVIADYSATAAAGVVAESNESNNSMNFTAPKAGYCSKVSVGDATAREGDKLTFTVSLAPASGTPVSVDYALTGGTAKGGSSCGRGTDFVTTQGTLQFAKGETSKQVRIDTCKDDDTEGPEGLTISLSRAANAEISKASATGTLTERNELLPGK